MSLTGMGAPIACPTCGSYPRTLNALAAINDITT